MTITLAFIAQQSLTKDALPADVASEKLGPISANLYVSHLEQKARLDAGTKTMRQPLQAMVDAEAIVTAAEDALSVAEQDIQIDKSSKAPAWQFPEQGYLTPEIPLSDAVISKAVVLFNHKQADYPEPGAQVKLPLLEGQSVTADVKHAVVTPNGDYSWSGHLAGYGTDYPITMTYGESAAFSMITTPEGSYTMETINGVGWLYKNPSELELREPGSTHGLEPEQTI